MKVTNLVAFIYFLSYAEQVGRVHNAMLYKSIF